MVTEVEGIKFAIEDTVVERFGDFKVDYGNMMFKKGFIISQSNGGGGGCH